MSNNYAICPQCSNHSLLYLNACKPKEILIKCVHCGNNQYSSIHYYLSQIRDISLKVNDRDKYCNVHHQLYKIYCIQCKLYLCEQCNIDNHHSHECKELCDIISTINIDNQFTQGFNYINNYCIELKTKK